MRASLALAWKDLRALRWTLLGWGAIALLSEVASLAFDPVTWLAEPAPAKLLGYLPIASLALPWFAAVLIAARIVQADSPIRSRAQWITRPVSPGRWLAAKLLVLGIAVCVVPAAVESSVAVWHGMLPADCVRAAASGAGIYVVPALASAAVGAVTPTLGAWALTIVLSALVVLNLGVPASSSIRAHLFPLGPGASLLDSTEVAVLALVLAASVTVIAWQARTRRTSVTRSAVAGVAGLAVLVSGAWPWNFMAPDRTPTVPAVVRPDQVVVGVDPARLRTSAWHPRGAAGPTIRSVGDGTSVSAVPDGLAVAVTGVHTVLSAASGDRVRFDGLPEATRFYSGTTFGPWSAGWPLASAATALGGVSWLNDWSLAHQLQVASPVLFEAPHADYESLAREPVVLEAEVSLQLLRYRVAARGPARVGTRLVGSGFAIEVLSLGGSRRTPGIHVRGGRLRRARHGQLPSLYALVNARRREALVGQSGGFGMIPLQGIGGTLSYSDQLLFPVERVENWHEMGRVVSDDAWFREAELVLLEPAPVGSIARRLSIEHFTLPR